MSAARIVLTIALSAGGVAASVANGSDVKPPSTEPVAQFQIVDGLVAKFDIGPGQTVAPVDDHALMQSESVSVVRCGVQSAMTTQNLSKGRPI
jgi:hypothetical protein